MNLTMKRIADSLESITLPSKLWAFHVDSEYNFIAALSVIFVNLKLHVQKAVILSYVEEQLKTILYIDNEPLETPDLKCSIENIADLMNLIYYVHSLKLCSNINCSNLICEKVITDIAEYCSTCKESQIKFDFDYGSAELLADNLGIDQTEIYACDKVINDFREENIVTVSPPVSKYCKFCPKTFTTRTQLKEHLRIHTDIKPYVCTICNKASRQRSTHLRHLSSHSDSKPNLCNVCGKTFSRGYRIEDHLLTHSSEKPFQCDVCKKGFSKSYNLKLHEKTHTGERPFICSICGKSYTTRSNLSTHVMSAHNEKKPHACGACDMSFVHPRMLRIHMRKHTGEKPYKCETCGKAFARNIHLTVHNRLHSGERPYVCNMCQKGFTTSGNMNAHKRIHHKN